MRSSIIATDIMIFAYYVFRCLCVRASEELLIIFGMSLDFKVTEQLQHSSVFIFISVRLFLCSSIQAAGTVLRVLLMINPRTIGPCISAKREGERLVGGNGAVLSLVPRLSTPRKPGYEASCSYVQQHLT